MSLRGDLEAEVLIEVVEIDRAVGKVSERCWGSGGLIFEMPD
jgi:hypothetical protein